MSLRHEFEISGAWLFRYRSFVPLAAVPLVVAALWSFTFIGDRHGYDEIWDVFSMLIAFAGLAVRALTIGYSAKGTSGRVTHQQVAETLNTTGMYSVVRHPLYLGNYLIVLGTAVYFHTWWMPILATCLYALYYERIMFAEEAFLSRRFGETFERWADATPSIMPRWRDWRQPDAAFKWRKVLRREYTGFFGVIAAFCSLEFAGDSIVGKHWQFDLPWVVLFVFGATVYVVLRTLKKHSRLLHVTGC